MEGKRGKVLVGVVLFALFSILVRAEACQCASRHDPHHLPPLNSHILDSRPHLTEDIARIQYNVQSSITPILSSVIA